MSVSEGEPLAGEGVTPGIVRIGDTSGDRSGLSPPETDPVFRRLWGQSGKDRLPRAETWIEQDGPAITARLLSPHQ